MQDVTRQLERIRRIGQVLLVSQRLMQAGAALLLIALLLGWGDYVLRLPSVLRCVVDVLILALALLWLVTRLKGALAFSPSLADLALRVERLYPQLSGQLASAVEFDQQASEERYSQRAVAMMTRTIEQVKPGLSQVVFGRLIDFSRTRKRLGVLLGALVLFVAVVSLFPSGARVAGARWLTPWQAVAWPKRTSVISTTAPGVWPIDVPLPLSTWVKQGYDPAMRVIAHYRVIHQGQPQLWQVPVLMNDQGQGRFERLIELPIEIIKQAALHEDLSVAFWFEADDDQTAVEQIQLVVRPAVMALRATIDPPAYAADLVGKVTVDLHSQTTPVATASAWPGSTIELTAQLNKPIPMAGIQFDAHWNAEVERTDPVTFTTTWPLRQTVDLKLQLTDEHGLSNLSPRVYRMEALEDRPPTVSITQPSADTSVLASAVIRVKALAQDDVGLARLALYATAPDKTAEALTQRELRRALLEVTATLDLQSRSLKPGQEVILTAVAQDVYQIDGITHEPITSSPRRLRIIDTATFISQLRAELSALRQQAIRLEQAQQQLADAKPANAVGQQSQLLSRLTSQSQLLDRLAQRAKDNRLEEPTLDQIMRTGNVLINQAKQASALAQQHLNDLEQDQARQQQDQVAQSMRQLAQLLDQSRDALTLELQLRQLQTQQARLAQDTRALLPQTVGQDRDALPQALQEALDELAQRQIQLSAQSQAMIRQMRATAESLAQQGASDREQAGAQALAQAAGIAQRQGLSQAMDQAAASTQQNRLSQASEQQSNALNTMQQMMRELDNQERHRQQRVRRRMQKLQEAIVHWLKQQTDLVDVLEQAGDLTLLEPTQSVIRRGTMAARQMAQASAKTQPVAQVLGQAVAHQADAVLALRSRLRQPARLAQGKAIAALEEALKQVRHMVKQDQQQQAQAQRDQLKQKYLELAQQQQALREQTALMVVPGPATRKGRSQLVAVGTQEESLRVEAGQLALQVDQTLVFTHLHRWIDEALLRVMNPLKQGQASSAVLEEQEQIINWLSEMAQALEEEKDSDDFASESASDGGGGEAPPMVPPLAELKLMRNMQQRMYEVTRQLDQAPARDASQQRKLMQLSTQQRDMARLGQAMIEKMKQQNTPTLKESSP